MPFVSNGAFWVEPADPSDRAQAAAYSRVHVEGLAHTYRDIIGPDFAARMRAEADDVAREDLAYLQRDDATAYLAWSNPHLEDSADQGGAAQPGADQGCCDVGADPALWFRPVGVALSRADGEMEAWERELGAPKLEQADGRPLAKLVTLYLLPEAQGSGLGSALLDLVLPGQSPAELWVIGGNDGAARFYERHGFRFFGERYDCEGSWAPGTVRRMVRGDVVTATS